MGGDGDWFYPGTSPFRFVNQKPRNLYGSQTGGQWPFWHQADYPFSKRPVYAPDATFHGANSRGFHGGEADRQWNETRASNAGSKRKPKVTSIPVQDGNAESLQSGDLQKKRLALPEDLESRVAGTGKGKSEGQTVLGSPENLKKNIPVIVSHNLEASKGASKAVMSDNAAATLMQSHFRGYMVRRTAPLNSLRVISSVMSQLRKIKEQIFADEYMDKLRADPKERVKLSETIMNLLLRLDALQGVHSTVREIRKAAVREAVALQETVDSLLKQSLIEAPQNSNAFPKGGCHCSADGSDFSSSPDDQDTQKHLEAAPVTFSLPGTFSESTVGRAASDVTMEISQLVDEENETRHVGVDTDCYITSDQILKTDARDSDDRLEMTSPSHTTLDDRSVATEFPRFNLGDDAIDREEAETDVTGDVPCDQNMEKNESSREDCATKVGSAWAENLQKSSCPDNMRSTILLDGEIDLRNDAEEGDQHLDNADSSPLLQDLVFQERSLDAIADSSCMTIVAPEAYSDALHMLQNENEELKSMLKRCQMTNELQTSLICDLRERLSLLERRLEEKTKTSSKSSSKCKKRSSREGRFSERRSNLNRNRSRQLHNYWLEDEICDVAARDDDRQGISE